MAIDLIKAPEPDPASTSTPASGSESIHDSLIIQGDRLAKLLAGEPLSESTKDFLSGLEGNCRRILATEDVDLDVIKFTRQELAAFLEGNTDLTYSNLVNEVCKRLQTLEKAFQKTLKCQRDNVWIKAVDNLVQDYNSTLRRPNESDSQNNKQTKNDKADDGDAIDQTGNNSSFGKPGDHHAHSRQIYESLSKLVKARCHMILQGDGGPNHGAIPHQVSSRAKDSKSLQDKAKKIYKRLSKEAVFEFGNALPDELSEQEAEAKRRLLNKIDDIAGARVLVYFPDDVPKIVEKINQDSAIDIDHATISFTKSRTDHRQQDNDAIKEAYARGHGEHLDMLNTSDGAFLSERTTIHDVAHRWSHSGYRAVHLTVSLNESIEEDFGAQCDPKAQSLDQRTKDQGPPTNDDEPGVHADSPQTGYNRKLAEIQSRWPGIKPIHFRGKRVEIQITSVVMHAWSQVEHDIIYKNPFGIPVNGTMTRMLDAINGQSITSEVLLRELRRSTDEIKDVMDKNITSPAKLGDVLEIAYLQENSVFQQKVDIHWAKILLQTLRLCHGYGQKWTLRVLSPWIPKSNDRNAVATALPGRKPDLALSILKNVGIKLRYVYQEASIGDNCECVRVPEPDCPREISHSEICYKLMLLRLCNAISLMLAMDVNFVWESLTAGTSPWGYDFDVDAFIKCFKDLTTEVRRILNLRNLRPEVRSNLQTFSERFMTHRRGPVQDAAIALAECGLSLQDEFDVWSRSSLLLAPGRLDPGRFSPSQDSQALMVFIEEVRPIVFEMDDRSLKCWKARWWINDEASLALFTKFRPYTGFEMMLLPPKRIERLLSLKTSPLGQGLASEDSDLEDHMLYKEGWV